jgi:shikimate kinase
MHYFLIGPGGVGKSTVAPILATFLDVSVVDLDVEYMSQSNIANDVSNYGYKYYYKKNSDLFFQLLKSRSIPTLFVLSSGFFCYPDRDMVRAHIRVLSEYGISIRLLPNIDVTKSINIIVNRQLQRGFGLEEQREREKFTKRFIIYNELGDIQIYSHEPPERIAQDIFNQLQTYEQSISKRDAAARYSGDADETRSTYS